LPGVFRKMYLVTGASSGIGRATTAELLKRGESVLAVARNNQAISQLKPPHGEKLIAISADVSTEQGLAHIIEIASQQSFLQGVVHCAGSPVKLNAYQKLQTKEVTHHFNVHVLAPIALNQRLKFHKDNGRIVQPTPLLNLLLRWRLDQQQRSCKA